MSSASTRALAAAAVADPLPSTPPGADRRGALRPGALVSPRARLETVGVEKAFRAVEACLLALLAVWFCREVHPQGLLEAPLGGVLPYVLGAPLLISALVWTRAYSVARREALRRALARAAAAFALTSAGLGLLFLLLPPGVADPRAAAAWLAASAGVVVLLHLIWWRRVRQLHRAGLITPNVVIVGATANAERLIEETQRTGEAAVLGIFDDRLDRAPSHIQGVQVLGDTAALIDHRVMPYVDRVVITVPAQAQGRVRELIERLRILPNEISLFIDIEGEPSAASVLNRLAQSPLAQVSGRAYDQDRLFAKRLQDILLGTLALLVAGPAMLMIALAVKLDSPGPVFFRQRRHGFNNEEIVVWKFRSMRHETADARAHRQVAAGDDRITRVGRFIRPTSLDELPQLFNVLRGEMSLVGPRPHAIGMKTGDEESARLVGEYAHRHRMKPGITGWAAIHGSRGPVDTPEAVRRRVALDVEYIERQSFWLDIYILLMTVPCLFGDRDGVR